MERIFPYIYHWWKKPKKYDLWSSLIAAGAIAGAVVTVGLLAAVVWLSFYKGQPGSLKAVYSFENYRIAFLDPFILEVTLNTTGFAFTTLVVAFLVGIPIAWLVERTDFPAKTVLIILMSTMLLIPSFLVAMGWLFLLSPRIGIINQLLIGLFGLAEAPIRIDTVIGMGWVQGLSLAPLTFIMTATALRAVDPALEEAAHVSGVSQFQTMLRVTLPVIWPAVLATAIYIFTIGIAAFDIPAIIGLSNRIFTFSTYIYLLAMPEEGVPKYGIAAALGSFLIIIALLFSWWYSRALRQTRRYEVITGKAYRPKLTKLGRGVFLAWLFVCGYILIGFVMPILMLCWTSLLPYLQVPSAKALSSISIVNFRTLPWGLILRGAFNTGVLMLLVPTITIIVSFSISWVILRSRMKGRLAFDSIAFLPHVVPHMIFSVGALLIALFLLRDVLPIYGTIWILVVVFVIVRISLCTRITNSALIQIHRELEESAYVAGARTWGVMRRIVIPLIIPSLIYTWVWIALVTYRELTVAAVLATPSNLPLSVVIFSAWITSRMGQASAMAIIMVVLLVPLIALYWFIGRRIGSMTAMG